MMTIFAVVLGAVIGSVIRASAERQLHHRVHIELFSVDHHRLFEFLPLCLANFCLLSDDIATGRACVAASAVGVYRARDGV